MGTVDYVAMCHVRRIDIVISPWFPAHKLGGYSTMYVGRVAMTVGVYRVPSWIHYVSNDRWTQWAKPTLVGVADCGGCLPRLVNVENL